MSKHDLQATRRFDERGPRLGQPPSVLKSTLEAQSGPANPVNVI
jgi:hypothetical protein